MGTMGGQWRRGLVVLIMGSGLLFTGCAGTMMGSDKEMMKEGGMMKKEDGMMKEEGMMKKDGGMMKEEKPTMEKK